MLAIASFSYAALLVVFSLVRAPIVAYALLLAIGFMMILNNALANSLLQHLIPNELRGRLMAAYSFVVVGLSQVLGSLVAGSIAHVIGVSWAIGGAAGIMLAYTYFIFTRRPELKAL